MLLVLAWYVVRERPGVVFGGAIVAMLALPMLPKSYQERLSSIVDESKDDTGSREARKTLFRESLQAFKEHPLTGVGAGQFKNWNPEGREQPWRESQVGAELGVVGLAVFCFLIVRSGLCVRQTRRLLRRARAPSRRASNLASVRAPRVTRYELEFLDAHSAAMAAAVTGWFICALFASVAYNWTFYYLLALAAAPRDIILDRMRVGRRALARRMAA